MVGYEHNYENKFLWLSAGVWYGTNCSQVCGSILHHVQFCFCEYVSRHMVQCAVAAVLGNNHGYKKGQKIKE